MEGLIFGILRYVANDIKVLFHIFYHYWDKEYIRNTEDFVI